MTELLPDVLRTEFFAVPGDLEPSDYIVRMESGECVGISPIGFGSCVGGEVPRATAASTRCSSLSGSEPRSEGRWILTPAAGVSGRLRTAQLAG